MEKIKLYQNKNSTISSADLETAAGWVKSNDEQRLFKVTVWFQGFQFRF